MIDWRTIKQRIQSEVAALAGLDPQTAVRWVDEPGTLVNGVLPIVWLRARSVVGVGIEEERRQDAANGDDQSVNVCGQRQFTLSIRAESFTADVSDPRYSGNVIDAIRTRMMRSSAREARGGAYSVARRLGTNWFSYVADSRPISCHVVDFLMNTADNDADDSAGSGDFILEAQVHGDVKDTSGATIESVDVDANARP